MSRQVEVSTARRPEECKLVVVDDGAGVIEGYASVFGNIDLGGDVVERGAFKKTIKERVPSGSVKLMDNHKVYEGTGAVIGVVEEAKEDDYGLHFRARMSSVPRAQDVRTKVKEKVLDSLSFGYNVIKDQFDPKTGVRYLKELKLYEISVVIWGMNPKAQITLAKQHDGSYVAPWATSPSTDNGYVSTAALERIKNWVSAKPVEEWSDGEWGRFRKCFLIVDGDPSDVSSYLHPFVDIDEEHGAPVMVKSAIECAADSNAEVAQIASSLLAKFSSIAPPPLAPPPPAASGYKELASLISVAALTNKIKAAKSEPPFYTPEPEGKEACKGCGYFKTVGSTTGLCTAYNYMVSGKGYCTTFDKSA
jgi:HK97 family phage prohead protease